MGVGWKNIAGSVIGIARGCVIRCAGIREWFFEAECYERFKSEVGKRKNGLWVRTRIVKSFIFGEADL